MRMRTLLVAGVVATGLTSLAIAQQGGHQMHQQMMQGGKPGQGMNCSAGQSNCGMDHSKMDHGQQGKAANTSPSTAAFQAANARMHQGMDIAFSGDADIDFIKGMIPHHQGAIDMAKVVLGFGKDEETRKLAGEIIAAQEKEIAMMKEWLKKKGQ